MCLGACGRLLRFVFLLSRILSCSARAFGFPHLDILLPSSPMTSSQRSLFAFVRKSLLGLWPSLEAVVDDAVAAEDWVDVFATALVRRLFRLCCRRP